MLIKKTNTIIINGNKSTLIHKLISISQKVKIYTTKTVEKVGIHKTSIYELEITELSTCEIS